MRRASVAAGTGERTDDTQRSGNPDGTVSNARQSNQEPRAVPALTTMGESSVDSGEAPSFSAIE